MKEKITAMDLALKTSLIYPSFEIYGGKSGFYEFGDLGVKLKKKIEGFWREFFIKRNNFFEIEGVCITPRIVLEASGHVEEFTDPIVECKKCKKKYRADKLGEEKGYVFKGDVKELEEFLKNIRCECGGEFSEVKLTNLMFKTEIGYEGEEGFLRPETAQNIFTSFKRFYQQTKKLPLAIGQIGKSFRNEISPRNVLSRLREFTQAEIEVFFDPHENEFPLWEGVKEKKFKIKKEGKIRVVNGEEFLEIVDNKILAFLLAEEWEFYKEIGLDERRMWFRVLRDDETPHYSKANVDLEVETSIGIIEIAGNAYRGDYDLRRHQEFSKESLEVIGKEGKIIPHVVELSMGIERSIFALLEHTLSYKDWGTFKFPPKIAPIEVSVFPLVKKEEIIEESLKLKRKLEEKYYVYYRETGSIGKRYAKSDEMGVPYAITIDYQSLNDGKATIRYRDDGKQERVSIDKIPHLINENIKRGKTKIK